VEGPEGGVRARARMWRGRGRAAGSGRKCALDSVEPHARVLPQCILDGPVPHPTPLPVVEWDDGLTMRRASRRQSPPAAQVPRD
jgi:hypothetical protein